MVVYYLTVVGFLVRFTLIERVVGMWNDNDNDKVDFQIDE